MKQLLQVNSKLQWLIIALVWFGLVPNGFTITPPPDGAYPGGNTAEGQNALFGLTTGRYNTAIGFVSLRSNQTNTLNTAVGAGTLLANTADANTAVGAGALLSNGSGTLNTASGAFALFSNTTGGDNTGIGFKALFSNMAGFDNNAFGYRALESHTANDHNNAFGVAALLSDQNGISNTAIGDAAMQLNVSGVNNTAVGDSALALSTGNQNTAIGVQAGFNVTTANDVICIGSVGANVDNSCYIGNIYGATIDPATATIVGVDSTGKLGTMTSSQRFKRDIEPMNKASEVILKLKPVTFRYKSDPKNTPCYGLIAEKVAEASPELVVRDKDGKPYSVRYDQVNAMLLNEFLKEHNKVEAQESKIEKGEAAIAQLKTQIQALIALSKEQDSEIKKVRDQMEMNRSDAQLAVTHN